MKTLRFFGLALVAIFIGFCATSCSDDDDDDTPSGYYLHSNRENFIHLDHNTFYHGFIDDNPDYAIEKGRKYEYRNGKYYVVGWYESFTIVNGQLILSNGTFGSIEGKKLYYGGSEYTKE